MSQHKFTDRLLRHRDLLPLDRLGDKITIIGAGAIGSFTALSLAKIGFSNIEVWDNDKVEIHNLGSQFYRTADIDVQKVIALRNLVYDFTDVEIVAKDEMWDKSKTISGIVIMAVDSMAVRAELWAYCKGKKMSIPFIIDSRMGGESAMLYTMDNANDNASYEKSLYSDDNAEPEKCTEKATVYTVTMIAGLITKAVKDIISDTSRTKLVLWNIKDNAYQGWIT